MTMTQAMRRTGEPPSSQNAVVSAPSPDANLISPATIVLIVSVPDLTFIGLVASATLTVMAQRRHKRSRGHPSQQAHLLSGPGRRGRWSTRSF
jgi:hypothetical protein